MKTLWLVLPSVVAALCVGAGSLRQRVVGDLLSDISQSLFEWQWSLLGYRIFSALIAAGIASWAGNRYARDQRHVRTLWFLGAVGIGFLDPFGTLVALLLTLSTLAFGTRMSPKVIPVDDANVIDAEFELIPFKGGRA